MKKLILALVCSFAAASIAQAQTPAGTPTLATGGSNVNSTAMIGMIANTGVAGFMTYKATTASPPEKPMYIALAVMAAMNALNDKGGAENGSAIQAAATDTSGASGPGVSTADSGLAQKLAAQDQAIIQAAAGKGVTLSADGKTLNFPDGSSASAAQYGSDSNLKNMGMTDAGIAQLKADAADAAAKAKSQYNVASMGTDGGGGGALNNSNSNKDDDGDSKLKSLLGAFGKGAARKPASMSGLSKKLGSTGENIGVAGDDIFQMISRQYQHKDSQNTFIKTP